ncbi:hypothetical protein Tco_1512700 [Tanacetum coccineum]
MSKKQDCTAMSTAEAEYVALSASCAQVMWMRTQLKDYGFNYNKIPLYYDSQSAIAISCNPVTKYQLADMFTKALPQDRFKHLVRRIGMRCLTLAELQVFSTWMAFGGNIRDFGSFREEADKTTTTPNPLKKSCIQSLEMASRVPSDGVTIFKVTASEI